MPQVDPVDHVQWKRVLARALAGTGIRVEVVVGRYRAGESPTDLAADYRVPVELIHDAVRCELREAG